MVIFLSGPSRIVGLGANGRVVLTESRPAPGAVAGGSGCATGPVMKGISTSSAEESAITPGVPEWGRAASLRRQIWIGVVVASPLLIITNAGLAFILGYHWLGPFGSITYAIVAALSAALAALLGLLMGWCAYRFIHRRSHVYVFSVFALASIAWTIYGCRGPFGRELFVEYFEIEPGDSIRDLRGFVSQADFQDRTEGICFGADRETVDRLAKILKLDGPFTPGEHIGPIGGRNRGVNPVPNWFLPHELEAPLIWQRIDNRARYELYYDSSRQAVYLVVDYL